MNDSSSPALHPNASLGNRTVEVDWSEYFPGAEATVVFVDLAHDECVVHNLPRSTRRFPPCSTFKIPNAMIGLETGVIPDADHVIKWDGVVRDRTAWNQDHTLRSSMGLSVVWYFQELARRVGPERMEAMLAAIDYGNQAELHHDPAQPSGTPSLIAQHLTTFWLNGPLTISAQEQAAFLRKLHEETLLLSSRSIAILKEIATLSTADGATFRGKTGSGVGLVTGKNDPEDLGWFIGWVEGPRGTCLIAANASGEGWWGPKVREGAEAILRERGVLPR